MIAPSMSPYPSTTPPIQLITSAVGRETMNPTAKHCVGVCGERGSFGALLMNFTSCSCWPGLEGGQVDNASKDGRYWQKEQKTESDALKDVGPQQYFWCQLLFLFFKQSLQFLMCLVAAVWHAHEGYEPWPDPGRAVRTASFKLHATSQCFRHLTLLVVTSKPIASHTNINERLNNRDSWEALA